MRRLWKKLRNRYWSQDRSFAYHISDVIGFMPAEINLYKHAFFHRSSQNGKDGYSYNNERLEYLGDALLSSIVAEYLYCKYPKGDEGFLTKMRSRLVKRKTLNDIAEKMELDVLLGEYNKTHISKSMLGNALEALVGAVYLEKGYDGAKYFVVHRLLHQYVDMKRMEQTDDNDKSTLLEYCQKVGKEVQFRTVSKYKQQKRDKFKMAVVIDGREIATADAFNKKSAEQRASRIALKSMDILA